MADDTDEVKQSRILHSSSKKNLDRYLVAKKPPFTRRVSEFLIDEFVGGPEGKIFSWIDLGMTQIEYVDPVKLSARINKCGTLTDCITLPPKNTHQTTWIGNDTSSLEDQIKLCTKSLDRCCINLDARDARAFGVCRIPLARDGTLGIPSYNVKLISTNPFRKITMSGHFVLKNWTLIC
ncbi:hypothetical protein OS493_016053 [Desmophyllum pertusum]|uniref:Uncharacterized protein n=1 Tax=Desmophyllum pertusum TaxID=174260 RepID=A0A9X0D9S1_9CNID|nr:hypothetical protein OS493_016053 [Desmophyllum pertusum]